MSRYKWVILGLAGAALIVRIAISLYTLVNVVPASVSVNALPVIIIDPGHGGIDGGAVGANNIVEKDINLNISFILKDLLEFNGYQVIMTRDSDISIHDEGITSVRKQKTSDLHNRLKIIQDCPGSVFISIHQNKFGDTRSNGTQIFFSPNHPDSQRWAKILQQDVVLQLQKNNKREIKKAGKNLFLMTQAKCPAILMECGFLSNPSEAKKLTKQEYQAQLAFVAFQSIMELLTSDLPELEANPQPIPNQ